MIEDTIRSETSNEGSGPLAVEASKPLALDDVVCERARQTRDPRFDGRFYIGVLTTGIYCRPICPVQDSEFDLLYNGQSQLD